MTRTQAFAQPRLEKRRGVGQQVEWHAGRVQSLDPARHFGEIVVEHLVEAAVERRNQIGLGRMKSLQTACRFEGIATVILDAVPRRRRHFGEEPLHFGRSRDELSVEMPGVPIQQHAAHVEDHDGRLAGDSFGGCFQGHF